MRAGELIRLLSLLPEDMPVLVGGYHIDRIYKTADDVTMIRGDEDPTRCETGRCVIEWHYHEVPAPAHIDIHGKSIMGGERIGEPEPPVSLKAHGRARWPRAAFCGDAAGGAGPADAG